MILLFDFSRVLLFPTDSAYSGSLNGLYKDKKQEKSFDFFNYFSLNKDLLDYLKSNQDTFELFMFTSESIQDAPELSPYIKPLFKKIFSALDIGHAKKDPQSFREIVKNLNVEASDITFIDDSLENIQAVEQAGLKTIHYVNNEDLFKQLGE